MNVVTLISPFKAKIIDKLRTLPKYASKIAKFESLAKAKSADELVDIAESLSQKIGKNINDVVDDLALEALAKEIKYTRTTAA